MKKLLTRTLLAAAIGGAMLSATPASAASVSINVAFGGIGFSYNSGGYCDSWGCPDRFWNYPIYYCPVYYRGRWYSGPVYYRQSRFGNQYWIHGGWRRDMWYDRSRPRGICVDRYGPPLDLDFYIWNGFNVRDQWRYDWRNQRNDWWNRRQQWDRTYHNDTSWQSWVPTPQRNYDWNRQRSWNSDREWTRPDWNRSDWERQNNIRRSGTAPFGGANPPLNRTAPVTAPSQMAPVVTAPAVINPAPNTGGRNRDGRKGGQNNMGAGGGASGAATWPPAPAATAPAVTAPAVTAPATNVPAPDQGRHKWNKDNQGAGGGVTVAPASQMAPAATVPAVNNPPADKNADRHNRKDKNGKDDKAGDSNNQH